LDKTIKKPYGKAYPLNPQTIGDQIRRKRIEKGMFQKEVAILFGVSEDTITNWENNRTEAQIQFYPKINAFLLFKS
jgi:transcriptional regulator with XRE-family HTH domain